MRFVWLYLGLMILVATGWSGMATTRRQEFCDVCGLRRTVTDRDVSGILVSRSVAEHDNEYHRLHVEFIAPTPCTHLWRFSSSSSTNGEIGCGAFPIRLRFASTMRRLRFLKPQQTAVVMRAIPLDDRTADWRLVMAQAKAFQALHDAPRGTEQAWWRKNAHLFAPPKTQAKEARPNSGVLLQ